MSHFDSCQLTLIWLVRITLNWQPWLVKAKFHFIFIFMLVWHIISVGADYSAPNISLYVGKTTDLSSEPARWSCDYCRRMSDFDSCQFILIRMAYKVSPRCDIWHQLTWSVCRVCVGYVITKFSRMDSLPNLLTHGAPQPRASRESSAIITENTWIALTPRFASNYYYYYYYYLLLLFIVIIISSIIIIIIIIIIIYYYLW